MSTANLPQRFVGGALVAVMTLSTVGCKTSPPAQASADGAGSTTSSASAPSASRKLTAAEKQMRADESRFQKTVIGGVIQGALIGGALGYLAALAGGANSKEAGRTAGAGAVVGGVMGGIDGYVVAKREQNGKNELKALQAAAADVRADNKKLEAFMESSSVVLNEGKERLAALKGDVDAKRISVAQAEEARKREEQNIASMKSTLAQAKKTKEDYAKASAQFKGTPQDKRDLDAEVERMNQQVAKLENNIADYNRAVGVSRAG